MELALGHMLRLTPKDAGVAYRFQNYAIGQEIEGHLFLPFAFGGAVATLRGDNLDATIQFANTPMTRSWVTQALDGMWVAQAITLLFEPSSGAVQRQLYEYWGVCAAGGWDETTIQVSLNNVLDAVEANVPGRRLERWLIGKIPFTSDIRV